MPLSSSSFFLLERSGISSLSSLLSQYPNFHFNIMGSFSVCKSGLITGKRPEPDRTRTCQDRKLAGPFRTVTMVQSTVHHKFEDWKTAKRLIQPVLTSLFSGLQGFAGRNNHNQMFNNTVKNALTNMGCITLWNMKKMKAVLFLQCLSLLEPLPKGYH